jgi:SOS response regulatory protein OraA/RecX
MKQKCISKLRGKGFNAYMVRELWREQWESLL